MLKTMVLGWLWWCKLCMYLLSTYVMLWCWTELSCLDNTESGAQLQDDVYIQQITMTVKWRMLCWCIIAERSLQPLHHLTKQFNLLLMLTLHKNQVRCVLLQFCNLTFVSFSHFFDAFPNQLSVIPWIYLDCLLVPLNFILLISGKCVVTSLLYLKHSVNAQLTI